MVLKELKQVPMWRHQRHIIFVQSHRNVTFQSKGNEFDRLSFFHYRLTNYCNFLPPICIRYVRYTIEKIFLTFPSIITKFRYSNSYIQSIEFLVPAGRFHFTTKCRRNVSGANKLSHFYHFALIKVQLAARRGKFLEQPD